MKKSFIIAMLLAVIFIRQAPAQDKRKKRLPMSAIALQFAGSTGFLTAGYFRGTETGAFQFGLLYGNTPKVFGGSLHSFSFKFIYDPFKINLGKKLNLRPLQAGAFLSQSLGKDLNPVWSEKYPKSYYWWPPSLRQHIFLSSEVSMQTKSSVLDQAAFYFEANTNDLYLVSYFRKNNHQSLSFYDIVFFGMGLKFYLKEK